MTEVQIIQGLQNLGTIGGIAAIAWALRPLWSALAALIKRKGDDKRITDLQDFRETAENNHFHDIEELKKDRREMWAAINSIRKDLSAFQNEVSREIGYIKGRINGHNK